MSEEISRMKEMLDNLGADKYPREEYLHIGQRGPRRVDGLHKAGGRADYTMDVQLPGMLHMRFLTSPYPNAKIVNMNTTRAEGLPGVRAVLRYDDPELPETADLGGHVPQAEIVLPSIVGLIYLRTHHRKEDRSCGESPA